MLFTTATFDNDVCAQGREVPHVKGLWYLGDVFCDAASNRCKYTAKSRSHEGPLRSWRNRECVSGSINAPRPRANRNVPGPEKEATESMNSTRKVSNEHHGQGYVHVRS